MTTAPFCGCCVAAGRQEMRPEKVYAGDGLQNIQRRITMKMNRRTLLKKAAVATPLGSLLSGLPSGWVGTAYASDAPETTTIRFGIIALTDNASIVMAHELGYFKKFGIDSVISKEASWAVIRDKLNLGENQATHMLIGMPFASTMGLLG